jgi:hypothetical protein
MLVCPVKDPSFGGNMKRIIIALVGVLAASAGAEAQSNDQVIQRAIAPLSARNAGGAAVVRFNADGSYTTLREGSNAFVCYDRSGQAGAAAFAVQCTNTGNLARLVQNRQFAAQAAGDRAAMSALVAAADANGTRVMPEFGSVWISMNGENQASAGTHTTFAVPNATTATLGLPDNGRSGGIWIMGAGTSEAHLMIPQG